MPYGHVLGHVDPHRPAHGRVIDGIASCLLNLGKKKLENVHGRVHWCVAAPVPFWQLKIIKKSSRSGTHAHVEIL